MTFRVRRASNRRRRQSASPAAYSAAGRNCTSGILGIAGIVLALWSASNYVAAFMRASNAIYDVPEGRPTWKTAPIRLGVTVVTMILLVAAAFIVVVTGSLARKVGDVLGIGATAVSVWDIAKWPVLLIIIGLILAILFWAGLAGIIIFLIWMWISNVAILLGAEFNAELERGRAVAAGHPADREPFSELRDDRKLRKEGSRR